MADNEDSLDVFADAPEMAAEVFARHVHDTWGVGIDLPNCGGTGVLLFLSIEDRSIFLSKGGGVEHVLTGKRLDRIISKVKPLLGASSYKEAILKVIEELDQYLTDGPPDWTENAAEYSILAVFVSVIGFLAYKQKQQSREYARVASHLSELDRTRAEALQGKFQSKSCPICLEDFQQCRPVEGQEATANATDLLVGSDGLPVKLLRCGHVFDETCWNEWIRNGRNNNKCPICKQDVAGSADSRQMARNPSEQSDSLLYRGDRNDAQSSSTDTPHRNSAVWQRYTQERNFRLQRLGARYPQYIQSHQLERWLRSGYDGSLSRDQSFVRSNPDYRSSSYGSSRNFNTGSGFGGGRSSGGRGGTW